MTVPFYGSGLASSISATPSVVLAIIARLLSLKGDSVRGCAVTGRAGYS
jgi:hypothetical protein